MGKTHLTKMHECLGNASKCLYIGMIY